MKLFGKAAWRCERPLGGDARECRTCNCSRREAIVCQNARRPITERVVCPLEMRQIRHDCIPIGFSVAIVCLSISGVFSCLNATLQVRQ